jgi:hypothetical protein
MKAGCIGLNWLRVCGNIEASQMAQGLRQPLHILEGRSEQCIEPCSGYGTVRGVVAACLARALMVQWSRLPRVKSHSRIIFLQLRQ